MALLYYHLGKLIQAFVFSLRELIDTSFRKLRSAEAAFELLQSFKSIKSKGAIQRQMMSKLNDILQQFSREIETATQIFEIHRADPPLTRNQPPVAGAIKWSRSLFARLKHTMNKLLGMEADIRSEEAGRDVHDRYMSLARMVLAFEREKFGVWAESADNIAMQHLKQSILRREGKEGE